MEDAADLEGIISSLALLLLDYFWELGILRGMQLRCKRVVTTNLFVTILIIVHPKLPSNYSFKIINIINFIHFDDK